MTVKELIIKLLDMQANFDEPLNISIVKEISDTEKIIYVGDGSIEIEEPANIGDTGVWIKSRILHESEINTQAKNNDN